MYREYGVGVAGGSEPGLFGNRSVLAVGGSDVEPVPADLFADSRAEHARWVWASWHVDEGETGIEIGVTSKRPASPPGRRGLSAVAQVGLMLGSLGAASVVVVFGIVVKVKQRVEGRGRGAVRDAEGMVGLLAVARMPLGGEEIRECPIRWAAL